MFRFCFFCSWQYFYTPHGNVQTVVAACMVRSNDKRRRITDAVVAAVVVVGVVQTGAVMVVLSPPPTNMVQFSSKLSRKDDMIDIRRCCILPASFSTFDIRRGTVLFVLFVQQYLSSDEKFAVIVLAFLAVLALVVESFGKNFSCILDKSVFDSSNMAGVLEPRR